ncbi:general transcription and DNA repair factor IIH subunit TFB2 isoform X2 [Nymphaea colorata]|uniref:general transcription and DNA repair factor IIH subunit TFB2 isoform X2 n=1 Tax=Nymphaea colorata TaxID=210225 RepID=UPI00129D841A|nr:general transcription and DNA repair factor IIH subunit TFB2 isoform X2 [Nymphaea colorata]
MPQVRIIAKNFMDLVAALPVFKLDKLYDSVFVCEAIMRSLPPLSKKYVLQMLYIDVGLTAKLLEEWVLSDGLSKHKAAVDRLLQLRIFIETVDRKKETSYTLNEKFKGNLQKYIVNGEAMPREPMPSSIVVRLPTLEELEAYALEQWENFLLQLIRLTKGEKSASFSSAIMKVVQRGLLSSRDNDGLKLTENGFQFLLMDTNAQLWYIIREYISTSEDRGTDSTDLISFLLELSFHATGEAYNMNTLTEVQEDAIKDLSQLGLVKLQQGFIVVETNFKLYANSSSKLHCEILDLFSRIEYQVPNLIVGSIAKESLYLAFSKGITAEQIITFLQQNAHPRVATRIPTVPENVTDQIRLWEADRNRVEMIPSHLYDDFPSKEVFENACDFARETGGLLWEDSQKMILILRGECHEEMRNYLRRQR